MRKVARYEGIQALRFVAALLVVITHSTFYAHERLSPSVVVWKGGTVGVDIFFVISGFVMTVTAEPFMVRGGWKNFAVRRVVRIVPMYWIATTLKVATMLALPGAALHAALTPLSGVASYLFLPSRNPAGQVEPLVGPGWTLNFEMLFYAVFATGLLLRKNVLLFAGAVMVVIGSLHAVRGSGDWPTWAFYLDSIVLYFVVGIVVGKLATTDHARRNLLVVLGVALAGVLACVAVPHGVDWSRDAVFRKAVVVALFVVVVLAEPFLRTVLPRAVLFLGEASYSLYLFHSMLAPVVPVALGAIGVRSGPLSVAGSIVGSVVAAALIYRYVERPITRSLRRLPYAGVPRTSAGSPVPARVQPSDGHLAR